MTCIHINDAKTKIEILIGSDSSIQTEMGPFLTVEESESIVAKDRFFSGDLREIKNISKKYPAIDKNLLREKLKEINLSLSQCNCLNKANESEKQKLEEEKRKLRQKESKIDENESEILLIKNENERLKRTIANLGGELTGIEKSVKGSELSSKKNELAQLISKSKGGEKGWKKEVVNLESLYQSLIDASHKKNHDEVKEIRNKISESKGELYEKELDSKDISEIERICREIAELELEISLKREEKQQYEARIETPLKMITQ